MPAAYTAAQKAAIASFVGITQVDRTTAARVRFHFHCIVSVEDWDSLFHFSQWKATESLIMFKSAVVGIESKHVMSSLTSVGFCSDPKKK